MRHAIFLAALASALMLYSPGVLAEGGPPVPVKRAGGFGALPFGGKIERKSPAREKVRIDKDEVRSSALIEKKDPLVMLTSPRAGEVDRAYQMVSGRVGSGITKVFLRINEDTRVVAVNDGSFITSGALVPGINTITALAWDFEGNLGKDFTKIFFSPDDPGSVVRVTEPEDGLGFDATENRVITVRAVSDDKKATRGVIIVNGLVREVVFSAGRMVSEVPLFTGVNRIRVEAELSNGAVTASAPIRVNVFDARPKDLVASLTWNNPNADCDLHVWDSFGHHTYVEAADPFLCEAAIPMARLNLDSASVGGPEVFTLEAAESEVYRIYVAHITGLLESDTNATLNVMLHGDIPARRIIRVFGPHRMDSQSTSWEAAVVKMPEGVFFQEKDTDLVRTLAMDSKAVRRLLMIIEEENPSFRLLAMAALGQIKSEEAVPRLRGLLRDESIEIRRAAAGALWSIRSVDSVDALIGALIDPDHEVRRTAVGALGYIGSADAVRPITTLVAEEGDPMVKMQAVRALGEIGAPMSATALIPLLKDGDAFIRSEAARSLGRLGGACPPESVPELIEAADDQIAGVREILAWALGNIGDKRAQKTLLDLLYFDDSEGVRSQAALALGRLGSEEGAEELTRAAEKDKSDKVRFCAREALKNIYPEETTPASPALAPLKLDDDVIVY